MALTTLGTLAAWIPPPEDEPAFLRLVDCLDTHYPDDWRSWQINAVNYEAFLKDITPDTEARLRFALPTIAFAKIFEASSLSERRYRDMKRRLLNWPLGVALIYQPLSIMAQIHPIEAYNKMNEAIQTLRADLLSRHEAASILRGDARLTAPPTKRSLSPSLPDTPTAKKQRSEGEETLAGYMRKQTELLTQLISQMSRPVQATTNSKQLSPPASPTPYTASVSMPSESGEWNAPPFVDDKECASFEDEPDEPVIDFTPNTKEIEPKITKASQKLSAQGSHCQRLNGDGWRNIRYAEVQKEFQASPVFTSLKVNNTLAAITPNWLLVPALEKMDLCLGAICHGLLQQRDYFDEIKSKAPPEVRSYLNKNYLAADSAFRKTSDALLQYTCGKRAEIIEQRRAVYKPSNKVLHEVLHAIPPSDTHLFAEPQLSELVKEQGGTAKFFPFQGKLRRSMPLKPRDRKSPRDKPQISESRKQYSGALERKASRPKPRRPTRPVQKKKFDTKRY